jgi:hypothetical protein
MMSQTSAQKCKYLSITMFQKIMAQPLIQVKFMEALSKLIQDVNGRPECLLILLD